MPTVPISAQRRPGAGLQALHAVFHPVARGQDQHRHLDPSPPKRRQNLEAVANGQHQVQQDQIERLGVREEIAFLARSRNRGLVPLGREAFFQRLRDLGRERVAQWWALHATALGQRSSIDPLAVFGEAAPVRTRPAG